MKVDGDFTQKFKANIGDLMVYRADLRISRTNWSRSYADFEIKVSYLVGDFSVNYYSAVVRVAVIADGVLKGLKDPVTRRTDYDPIVIRSMQEEIRALRLRLHEAESKIYPFRESD